MDYITKIFVIEDDEFYAKLIEKALEKENKFDVKVFSHAVDFLNQLHENPDIVTIDHYLPDLSGLEILKKIQNYNKEIISIIVSGQDDVEVVVDAYNNGASDYIVKKDNSVVKLVNSIKNFSKNVNLQKEVEELREKVIDREKYRQFIGESKPVLKVLRLIQKVEKTNMIVLVTGESGTGKEVVARMIHYNSPRKKKSFIPVNMAAIPEDLIESELFGHEKGAFTGATSRRIGKFEEANNGTIFLDEIGEMEIELQTKLLRVLQDNSITRVGSNKEIRLDVRVIAATNKDLTQRVKEGKFREDLFYRLQGFLIPLPPLRKRRNDVIILANHFLKEFCKNNKIELKSLTKEASEILLNHTWPGNVRELMSVIERAILISESNKITPDDLIISPTPG